MHEGNIFSLGIWIHNWRVRQNIKQPKAELTIGVAFRKYASEVGPKMQKKDVSKTY